MKRIVTFVLTVLLLAPALATAADKKSVQDTPVPVATRVPQKKLDLNRASLDELLGVPGIGPRMAQAIIDLRSKTGSFKRIEELLAVSGIKEKKLASIAAFVDVIAPQVSAKSPAEAPSR